MAASLNPVAIVLRSAWLEPLDIRLVALARIQLPDVNPSNCLT
jgi:hypothetical protein